MRRSSQKKAEPQAQLPGTVKVIERREYQQTLQPAVEKAVIEVPLVEVEEDEPPDRFEEFFTRVRDQQGWTLQVYLLNTFDKDGKTDLRGNNTYQGRITFDPDTYLDDVQAMCPGGGTFKLQAKTPDNRFSEQWVEKVAPIRSTKSIAASNTHYIIQPQQNEQAETPPRDTLQELIDAGEKAARLKKVFGWDNEPQQVAASVAATVEREPLQDRIITAALESVLKSEKPETAAEILRAYLNPQQDSFSWKEIISELVRPLLPVVISIATTVMQRQAAQQGQQVNVVPPTQGALPPATWIIQHDETGRIAEMPAGQVIPQGWTPVHRSGVAPPLEQQHGTFPPQFAVPMLEIPQNAPPEGVTFSTGPAAQPQPQLEAEDEDEMAETDLLDRLVDMLQDCVNRAASDPAIIEAGRNEIAAFRERFPAMTQTVDLLTSAPPVAVIGMLCYNYPQLTPLINNPVAVQVIEDLQAALKRDDE